MKCEVYRDKRDEWRWRFRAANSKILAVSSEGYKNQTDCMHCLFNISESVNAEITYP